MIRDRLNPRIIVADRDVTVNYHGQHKGLQKEEKDSLL
jgi:hypothetical protein